MVSVIIAISYTIAPSKSCQHTPGIQSDCTQCSVCNMQYIVKLQKPPDWLHFLIIRSALNRDTFDLIKCNLDHIQKQGCQKQIQTKGGEEIYCFTTTRACVTGESGLKWSTTHVKSNKLLLTGSVGGAREAHLGAFKVEQHEVLITET